MTKKIDTVFVLALITLFAATSFILVLIGAKQYRHITNMMNINYETRTTSSYLAEKIHQNDIAGAISIVDLEGTKALCILTDEGDVSYVTYIYYYKDALRELVVTANSIFDLSTGQAITPIKGFLPSMVTEDLVCVQVTDCEYNGRTFYFHLESESNASDPGKEAP